MFGVEIGEKPAIEYKYYNEQLRCNVYKLNFSAFSEDECHIVYPPGFEEHLIATALEYMTFHPANQKMNDRFKFTIIESPIPLFWCSFPREFKDSCERAAKTFEMTMNIKPRVMILGEIALEFPAKENILCFNGNRSGNIDQIIQESKTIKSIGDTLEKLGID